MVFSLLPAGDVVGFLRGRPFGNPVFALGIDGDFHLQVVCELRVRRLGDGVVEIAVEEDDVGVSPRIGADAKVEEGNFLGVDLLPLVRVRLEDFEDFRFPVGPGGGEIALSVARGDGHPAVFAEEGLDGGNDGIDVAAGLRDTGLLDGAGGGGQEDAREDAENGDDDEEFDE